MEHKNKIGEVTEGLYFREYVGKGTAKLDNGKEVNYELSVGMGAMTPLVQYGNKFFSLSWKDILQLAEDAGLFEEEGGK